MLPLNYRYIIEFRDNSRLNQDNLSSLVNNKYIFIATSYLKNIDSFYLPNQELYYIRLIGDRQLNRFNKIQRKQNNYIENLQKHINLLKENKKIKQIFIVINNHFEGFSPETANKVMKVLKLTNRNYIPQKRLEDFF